MVLFELIFFLGMPVLIVGAIVRSFQRQRRALREAEQRADAAEVLASAAQLNLARLEADLSALERERLARLRRGSRPLHDPPAGLMPTFARLTTLYPDDPYTFAFGWEVLHGKPALACASVNPSSPMWTGNILLTAKPQFGKDTIAFLILWTLCRRNPIDRLQVLLIDGKGPDAALWQGRAHNFMPPVIDKAQIPAAMMALRTLRQKREQLLMTHKVTRWSELPTDHRPPLLMVYVSELTLLEAGLPTGESLEKWLAQELSSALGSGICYLIGTQTVSQWKTSWRDMCTTYIAGFQDSERAIEPNFGMYAKEITQLGAVLPTDFTAPGYFTIRIHRTLATVRAPALTIQDRHAGLDQLPAMPGGVVFPDPVVREKVSTVTKPTTVTPIPGPPTIPGPAAAPHKAAFLEGLLTDTTTGMSGIPENKAVSHGMVTGTDTDHTAMEEAIRTALARKEELTDDQIKYLRVVKQLAPTEIAMKLGAVRGDKRTRLDKIYRATGEQRAPVTATATDSSKQPEKSEQSAQPEQRSTPQSPTLSDPKLVERA